jgi:hypothetical protein
MYFFAFLSNGLIGWEQGFSGEAPFSDWSSPLYVGQVRKGPVSKIFFEILKKF